MAWVSLSPLMVYITTDLDISIEAKLRLSALAVVSGSLLRIPVGLLADKIGTKPTGIIVQSIALVAITSVYLVGLKSNEDILIFALFAFLYLRKRLLPEVQLLDDILIIFGVVSF